MRRAPYHRTYLNVAEAFLYAWVWWAAGLALIGIYYPQVSAGVGASPGWGSVEPSRWSVSSRQRASSRRTS